MARMLCYADVCVRLDNALSGFPLFLFPIVFLDWDAVRCACPKPNDVISYNLCLKLHGFALNQEAL